MARLPVRLKRVVTAIASVLKPHYGVCQLNICVDVTQAAYRLLEDAGYRPTIVGADPFVTGIRTEDGHEWLRIKNWNIDFGAGQFGLGYPFVSEKNSVRALNVYGPGSATPKKSKGYTEDTARTYYFHYPSAKKVLKATSIRELKGMSERGWEGPLMLKLVRTFRRKTK
jgi:hypothetical protein